MNEEKYIPYDAYQAPKHSKPDDTYSTLSFHVRIEHWLWGAIKRMPRIDRHLWIKLAIEEFARSARGKELLRMTLEFHGQPFIGYPDQPKDWGHRYFELHQLTVNMRHFLSCHDLSYTASNRNKAALALRAAGYSYNAISKLWERDKTEAEFKAALGD